MLIIDQLKKSDPRLRLVAVGVMAGMLLLLGGLWYHQVFSAQHYVETLRSQSFRTVRVPAIRGKILDHHGAPLAENRPNYKINLYLDELRPEFGRVFDTQAAPLLAAKARQLKRTDEGFVDRLIARLKGTQPSARLTREERDTLNRQVRYLVVSNSVATLARHLQTPLFIEEEQLQDHYLKRRAMPLTLLANLSQQQIALFQERAANLTGLMLDIQPMRHYPNPQATAHLLGYMRKDDASMENEEAYFDYRLQDFRGVQGLEGALDTQLRGRAGTRAMMVNNLGYRQNDEVWSPEEPGNNVVLTVDLRLQLAAWNAFRVQQGPNARGAVVVMDTATGDVLAMISSPTFDPNTFIPSVTPEEWARLQDEKLTPLKNRATQDTGYIAPGSIFKIVTGLAALEAGLDPHEPFTVAAHPRRAGYGVIWVGRRDIEDTAGAGQFDFRRAFIKSSNAYFVHHGLRAGIESIRRLAARLHLGERTRLPLMQDDPGRFPTLEHAIQSGGWSDGDTANVSMGQGAMSVTPIQMAVMVSAVVNGGKVYWPRLVERVEPAEFNGTGPVQTTPAGRQRDELGVSARSLTVVREAMIADVEDPAGTGTRAAVAGMKIGGKTGTAEVTIDRRVVDKVTWFASFGEHKGRTYAVVVMVQSGSSGGGTAAPIAQRVYQAIRDLDKPPAGRQLAGGVQ